MKACDETKHDVKETHADTLKELIKARTNAEESAKYQMMSETKEELSKIDVVKAKVVEAIKFTK